MMLLATSLVLEALKVMLFGMLGIFVVMGLIILSIKLLQSFGSGKQKESDQ